MRPEPRTSLGNRSVDEKFSLIYEELRRIASSLRRAEAHATIRSTALVDEAWIKLKDSPQLANTSTGHFKAIAANAMRQVLVEEARRRSALKRGGADNVIFLALGDSPQQSEQIVPVDAELLDLDAALNELGLMNPRQAKIVENIFFGGLTIPETARMLEASESLVGRDWKAAKAWLATRIRPVKE
jgi:RNA polymerase sigma factor (TIGR02999 family)